MQFDYRRPALVKWWDADIRNGDLAQVRGRGCIASLIRFATHGVHTHSGMIRVTSGGIDLLEVRELIGGRARPLFAEVREKPGRIDIFRPRARLLGLDVDAAVDRMRYLTARDYGYRGIARLALQRVPFVWRLTRADTRDLEETHQAPFCSHAIADAYRAGGVDPVPRKPDDAVTPNDLTWSLLFDYVGTLQP